MAKINLEKLSLDELRKLRNDIGKAISEYEIRKKKEAREAVIETAQEHGYKLSDLVDVKNVAKTVSPPKYKHPENPSKTWTGRGRQPAWIKEGLADGKTLEDFAI